MIRVEGDGGEGLGGGELEDSGAGLQPGLDGEGDTLFGAVLPGEFEGDREGHAVEVGEGDADIGAGAGWVTGSHVLDGLDGNVEVPVVEIPSPPEPGKVFTGFVVHYLKKVVGARMAEGPALDISFERIIKSFVAEDLLAQEDEPKGGFEIDHGVTILFGDAVGAGQHYGSLGIFQRGEDLVDRIAAAGGILVVAFGGVFSFIKCV